MFSNYADGGWPSGLSNADTRRYTFTTFTTCTRSMCFRVCSFWSSRSSRASQVPRLPWMSVGRTNPPRAGNLTSEASSTKMLLAPPNVSYIIVFCTMWRRPGHRKNLWQSFMVVARADLVAPPVCPLAPHQFVHSPLPYFSTGFLSFRISYFFSTALGLIFRVVHDIQHVQSWLYSMWLAVMKGQCSHTF